MREKERWNILSTLTSYACTASLASLVSVLLKASSIVISMSPLEQPRREHEVPPLSHIDASKPLPAQFH